MSNWRDDKMLPLMEMMAKNRGKTVEEMISQLESIKFKENEPISDKEHKSMLDYFDAMDETGCTCMPMHGEGGYQDTADFLRAEFGDK